MLGAVLALAGVAAGCSSGEEGRVKDRMHAWFDDLAHGRGPQACAHLTDAGRADFERQGAIGVDCEAGVRATGADLRVRRLLLSMKVRRVDVRGTRALIFNRDLDLPDELNALYGPGGAPTVLVKVDNRWLIDDLN